MKSFPDNQRLLKIREDTHGVGEPVLVENWLGELKRGMAARR
jgi:hypothetical protein